MKWARLSRTISLHRPWMCISVDRPLWEGSKPVSIPAGAWTPLRGPVLFPNAMPTETPSPWRIESLVSLAMEKRAQHAARMGVVGRMSLPRYRSLGWGKRFFASAKGFENHQRGAKSYYARVINCSTSRNRCHGTLESIATMSFRISIRELATPAYNASVKTRDCTKL